jgi:pimeloyl-ACP methyl ester carboxylesterase
MPTIDLPQGTVHYRVAGPEASDGPPVVFVHGFLVDGSLWDATAQALAAAGVRSYAPDWPLGSHRHPLAPGTDNSPRGLARQIVAFLEALELDDVTLVGNDTGGALCQFVLDTDASRIGCLVLTNCDAFDAFPPAPFDVMFRIFRRPVAIRPLMLPMKSTTARHSPAGYGTMARHLDAAQTRAWIEPCLTDGAIRDDVARFTNGVDPEEMLDVSTRLSAFGGPVTLVWGQADRFFKPQFARRLREAFADARLVELDGCRTFVPLDEPQRLADEVVAITDRAALTQV